MVRKSAHNFKKLVGSCLFFSRGNFAVKRDERPNPERMMIQKTYGQAIQGLNMFDNSSFATIQYVLKN